MDRVAWPAIVHGIAELDTDLVTQQQPPPVECCDSYFASDTRTESFPVGEVVKNPPANARDARVIRLIPGLGRSPGEGNGNLLQYSCLENPMDREA